nr:hypothetical protein [Saprospiraceae bacterium]
FANRIRGLIEEAIRKIDFWAAHIFRPAIIIGEESEQQWGKSVADAMGRKVDQYTGGWLKKNKPIDAMIIARAMLDRAQRMQKGTFTYRGDWLQDFATQLPPPPQIEKS